MFIRLFSVIFLISVFSVSLHAQNQPVEVVRSSEKVVIDRKVYYIHIVKPQQTLYSISRTYNVPQKDILLENPHAYIGLQPGHALKIPFIPEDIENEIVQEEPAGDYIYHTVEKGQTVYYLSRTYNVDEDEIIRLNPGVDVVLSVNQIVRIPVQKVFISREGFPTEEDKYIHHKVERGETVYSLSRQYDVPARILRRVNNKLIWGLKYGEYIKIPKHIDEYLMEDETSDVALHESIAGTVIPRFIEGEIKIDAECIRFDYSVYNKPFNVALMLPLYIDRNFPIELPGDTDPEIVLKQNADRVRSLNELYPQTEPFLEFYEGALLAVDSIRRTGVSVNLNIYDTERNPEKVREILRKPEFRNMDLIIGPVYPENMRIAAEWARQNRVNIVSPMTSRNELLADNPYLFQATPSTSVELEQASVFISNFPSSNFVLLHKNDPFERELVDAFKRNIFRHFTYNSNYDNLVFKEVIFGDLTANIEQSLIPGEKNIVILPSADQAFVTNVLIRLNVLSRNYDITIFGLNEWQRFANLEVEYLHNMELHYASPFFIDYEDGNVKKFLRAFRNQYHTEPGHYGFQGYDIMFYFLGAMKKYGPDFRECLPVIRTELLQADFLFRKSEYRDGFENNGISIVKYGKDMNIKRLGLNARIGD
jgi:LysM repeat protein